MNFDQPTPSARDASATLAPGKNTILATGEMANLVRAHDWSSTLLGPTDRWPELLLYSVNHMLACGFPTLIFWGPQMIQLYNDAFLPLMAEKHPGALGQQAAECWKEAWPVIGAQVESVLSSGTTIYQENVLVPVTREGKLRDIYWTYSYCPIFNVTGGFAGIVVICQDVTREVLAKRERHAAEEQLQQVLEVTTDAVAVLDRSWRFVYLNHRGRQILHDTGDMLGKNAWEEFPAMAYEGSPYVYHYHRAMDEGIAGQFETIYPEPLNIFLEIKVRPSRDGIIIFFRDVTEAKRAADELRASEELAQIALVAGGFGAWTLDLGTRQSVRTPRHDQIFGYEKHLQDWTYERFLEHVVPEDRARVDVAFRQALATGQDWESEARIQRPDGQLRWIWLRGCHSRYEQGEPTVLIGLVADITDRKHVEDALRESREALAAREEDLRWAVELSTQMPWTADREGNVLAFCDRWLELTGLTQEQARGDTPMLLEHPEDVRGVIEAWSHAVQTGEPLDVEHRVRTSSGEYRWMRSRAFPRRGPNGDIFKWYGATEDIHLQKKAEDALRTHEKLTVVGRLAASIAHEINNPLESVTNLLFLARTTQELPPAIQEYLDTADRELRRASMITNQTLRFYKQSTSPTEVHCQELIQSALSIHQGRIVNAHVGVEQRKRAERSVLCFDGEIRQVLNNLIGNAIDAMTPKGGRLLLRSREGTNWKTYKKGLILTVADTGGGISPSALKKIYDPFFTTKGSAGTGLGLWVSCEIVNRHNGVLRVRSSQREGCRGTVFTLFLPFDAARR